MERIKHMKTTSSDLTRFENMIDGLERLVLESTLGSDELTASDRMRNESMMRCVFAASAARAKLNADVQQNGVNASARRNAKGQSPVAVRLRDMVAMFLIQPDLEPRLHAVFENSPNLDGSEIDKILDDVGKMLLAKQGLPDTLNASAHRKTLKTKGTK